jgi:putative transposase
MPKSTGSCYTKVFKDEAVQLVRSSPERSIRRLAYELGISDQTLRNWIKQAQIDRGEREGLSTEEREELRLLRKENRVLREEREILKKPKDLLREGRRNSVSCYRLIEAEKATHSVPLLCRTLAVSRSGYYAWKSRPPSEKARFDAVLSEKIETIHRISRATYGAPRVHAELAAIGIRCSRKRVARLMRRAKLEGSLRGRRVKTTYRMALRRAAPDLVGRNFVSEEPDRLWVSDITYVRTAEGFVYLAFILDACSRRVVGWSMATHLRTEIVVDALQMAIARRKPAPGLVHHSDRGVQYTSLSFGKRLEDGGLLPSMGRAGSAYDNALAESFLATLKTELLYRNAWPTGQAARTAVFEYIEGIYNIRRGHSALGYLSPAEFEEVRLQVEDAA